MTLRRSRRRTRRTHLLGGCQNCRKRHSKCDQARPACLMCTTSGLICQGYESSVQWIRENGDAVPKDTSGTRAHLYTEQARHMMSSKLTAYFESTSIDTTLNEVDSWSRGEGPLRSGSAVIGPFGVLDITTPATRPGQPGETDSTTDLDNSARISQFYNVGIQASQGGTSIVRTPSILDGLTGLPDHLDWSDIFNLDVDNWFSPQSLDTNFEVIFEANSIQHELANLDMALDQVDAPAQLPMSDSLDDLLEKEAPELIRHFDVEVIGTMASLPFNQKSPYKILNVAASVQTYADLTYLNRPVKHASLANYYGILACSAQNLATNPSGSGIVKSLYWHSIAANAARKAKEQLQISLRDELVGPRKAKYKHQVMAMMNLLAYAVAAGKQRDVRCYLIDIERLLRLRGLPKRHISRRARLLHHMYTWNRIVGESTYVLHPNSSGTIVFTAPIPKPQVSNIACLDDFLRIDPGTEDDQVSAEDITEPDIALRDVHLQDTRQNPNTMYLQIYGLPETWLSLLSQTTRLANVREQLILSGDNTKHTASLKKRTSRLENMICDFASTSLDGRADTNASPSDHMLQALKSALVMFFYRRIMNVNTLILQSHVDDVIQSLQAFDDALAQARLTGPGTAWPAFIAGCEAAPGKRRDALLSWVDGAYWKTGSHCFLAAKEMMQEVWSRKRDPASSPVSIRSASGSSSGSSRVTDVPATWIDISREKNTWVTLC